MMQVTETITNSHQTIHYKEWRKKELQFGRQLLRLQHFKAEFGTGGTEGHLQTMSQNVDWQLQRCQFRRWADTQPGTTWSTDYVACMFRVNVCNDRMR